MKVTYIHQHYPRLPSEGGINRPWQFAKRLAADGHSVTLIAGAEEARETIVEGVRIVHVRAPYTSSFGFIRRIIAFIVFLARATLVAIRRPADVVLASSTPLTVAIPGMIAAAIRRARFVFEVRDLWPAVPIQLGILSNPFLRSLGRMLERLAYSRADTVIALSEGMAHGVRSVNSRVPVVVVPNASDFDLFPNDLEDRDEVRTTWGWGRDEIVLLYAGSFSKIYNLTWVIDLAAELKDSGIRIVLFGSGGTYPTLRQRAADLSLDVDSLLPGRLPRQELARVIAASDATISSVLREPCLEPASINKVFESMAARKAVFFNHDGWLTDLVLEHRAGWRLDNNPLVAAQQIREITAVGHALDQAGELNGNLGREHFDRNKLYVPFRAAVFGTDYHSATPAEGCK